MRGLLNAPSSRNVVFVRGATENDGTSWQRSWDLAMGAEGGRSRSTCRQHHANIVPWQQLLARSRWCSSCAVAPVDDPRSR